MAVETRSGVLACGLSRRNRPRRMPLSRASGVLRPTAVLPRAATCCHVLSQVKEKMHEMHERLRQELYDEMDDKTKKMVCDRGGAGRGCWRGARGIGIGTWMRGMKTGEKH